MKYKLLIFLIIVEVVFITILLINKDSFKNNNRFLLDSDGKFKIFDECKFEGIEFSKDHEVGECSVAIQIIPLCKNVIEIGGGAGKVSHMINKILSKNNLETQHIVVEPGVGGLGNHGDTTIYKNREKFNDKYTIIKKFCEDLTIDDLSILDHPPDCLYVDCEGCLYEFQNTDIGKYILENVKFIVNEMDGNVRGKDIDSKIKKQWEQARFKHIGNGYGCETNCITEIWSK